MFGGGDFKPKSAFVHVTLMGDQTKGDRMTIDLNVPADVEALKTDREAQSKFIADSLKSVEKELKFSGTWTCFACGDPAHELVHNPMSWLHAQPAFVLDYVHMICRISKPSCRKLVEASNAELTQEMGMGSTAPPQAPEPSQPPPEEEAKEEEAKEEEAAEGKGQAPAAEEDSGEPSPDPPARGCAVCFKTTKPLQCSRCKLIQYCSSECQKKDYPRHKGVCRWVDNVERSFEADKKEEKQPGGSDWPAGIPRPFDKAPEGEHDHSNC